MSPYIGKNDINSQPTEEKMKTLRHITLALSLVLATGVFAFAADIYTIDPAHSTIGFSIKHLTVSDVEGNFKAFEGTIMLDAKDPSASKFEATIKTKSINTQNDQRDEHLRGADFFDAENNPDITFKSAMISASGNVYTVTGDLTMKGVTKSVTIPLTVSGPIKSPMGGDMVIGLSGQTKINRQDFGVKWNKQMDQGGFVLGDEVTVIIKLEAHNKAPAM